MGTTTSTGNVDLVRSLGADEVIDYKKQEFEDVLRDYDAVLGTVRGDALEKSLRILKPGSSVVSLIGPPDAAFARARGMNFFMVFAVRVAEPQDNSPRQNAASRIRSCSCIQTVANSQRSASFSRRGASGR